MNLAKQMYWFPNLLCVILVTSVVCQSEKEACRVNKFMTGVCTVVTKCGLALEILAKGNLHHLTRCGFTREPGADEIVCCPSSRIIITNKEPEYLALTDGPIRSHQKYCEKVSKSPQAVTHIIHGKNSSEREFPHMASLGGEGSDGFEWSVCGAVIISPKFLLTAAHCFISRTNITKIRVGVTRINDSKAQDYNVKEVILHDTYDHNTKQDDIALIKIDGELKFNDAVFPACLYNKNQEPTNQTITGWGVLLGGQDDTAKVLQKAVVVTFDRDQCRQIYANRSNGLRRIVDTQFCLSSPPGTVEVVDACKGDSGGPGQIKNEFGTYSIVSIISFGQACGSNVPGVYTKVSSYVEWIEKKVWG